MSKKTPDFSDDLEESSLDEYGVWVTAGPDDSTDESDDSIADLIDDSQENEALFGLDPDLSLSMDGELSMQEPETGSLPEAGNTLKGQEVSDMSEQDKTKTASLTDNLEEPDISLDSSEEISLSVDDELGGLSDLLLNIDDETDQDDTIYLEDDDLSFDLNEENEDLLLEQESLDSQSSDDFGEDIVIPGLDDDLNIDNSENGLEIPQDTLEGLDDLDAELAELDDSLLSQKTPQDDTATIETHSVEEVGLDEFLNDQMDETEEISNDSENLSLDEDITFDMADSELDINGDLSIESDLESDISDELSIEKSPDHVEQNMDIDLGPEIDLDEELADTELTFDLAEDENHLPGIEQEIDSILTTGDTSKKDFPMLEDAEIATSTEFDDVEAFTSDISANEAPTKPETSNKILTSIEEELHAIRSELTDLRAELKKLRSRDGIAENPISEDAIDQNDSLVDQESVKSESDKPVTGGGFFDDDDDETIALTGDELDNILNTAEFTEEAGEPTNIDLEDDMSETPNDDNVPVSAEEFTFSDSEHETTTDSEHEAFENAAEENSFPPIEEISLEEIDQTDLSDNSEIDSDGNDSFSKTTENFQGSEHAVEQMAQMDIEKELAGIEDLKDEEEDIELYTGGELDSLELEIPEDFSESPSINDLEDSDELGEIQGFEEEEPLSQKAESPTPPTQQEPIIKDEISLNLKQEIKAVLAYMDQLLESLPENKIEEFARSEHFDVYKKLFDELGL